MLYIKCVYQWFCFFLQHFLSSFIAASICVCVTWFLFYSLSYTASQAVHCTWSGSHDCSIDQNWRGDWGGGHHGSGTSQSGCLRVSGRGNDAVMETWLWACTCIIMWIFHLLFFRDLIEQFRPWLKDALDLRKSDVREREREGGREREGERERERERWD